MIICHCTGITDKDIARTIEWMRAADPQTIITAGKIYRAMGKKADCGGCMPLFLKSMRSHTDFSVDLALPAVPAELRNLRSD